MKYQLLIGDPIQVKNPKTGFPTKLYRIIALKDFQTSQGWAVKEGEIGGFIQSEKNLSQTDLSWVSQLAKIYDNVTLENSYISGDAQVFENAKIINSIVDGKSRIYGNSEINSCNISDIVDVYDSAKITNSIMKNAAIACNSSELKNSEMKDGSRISGNSKIIDSILKEVAEVKGNSFIENCHLSGRTVISNGTLKNQSRNEAIELTVISNNAQN
jgi:ADP-glucose pyrophosphorylase